jgi:hypothetical protein
MQRDLAGEQDSCRSRDLHTLNTRSAHAGIESFVPELPEQWGIIVTMSGSKNRTQVQFTADRKGAVTSKIGSFDVESPR